MKSTPPTNSDSKSREKNDTQKKQKITLKDWLPIIITVLSCVLVVLCCTAGIMFTGPKYKGLIKNFKSTSYINAFILNSIAVAISIVIGVIVSQTLVRHENNHEQFQVKATIPTITIFISVTGTFFSYSMMFFLFGFGKGMFVD